MRREDRLATEEPLELRLRWPGRSAHRIWVTMRTPGHDFELAAGFLIHEGIAHAGQIESVAYCTDADLTPDQEFNVVTVRLADPPHALPAERYAGVGAGSACGVCGKDSISDILRAGSGVRWTGERPSAEVIRSLPARLRERQPLFERTGGVHGAGLASADGDFLVVREDVGRHNAVDKVTGARALGGHPTAEACLVVSGRASFELAQKAAAAGVGALVAVGAPTSLAVDLARETGLWLIGFTSPDRYVRYA